MPFRDKGDPILYLSNPKGVSREVRRGLLDDLAKLNEMKFREVGDPEITTRISQYEMAYRMQMSVPELTDFSDEPDHVFDLYGKHSRTPGTYAANCILARRLAERGVRFIQLFHVGWDTHGSLSQQLRMQCDDTDMASGALVQDLRARGLLEDTLVIWAGEFGRTPINIFEAEQKNAVFADGPVLAKAGDRHRYRAVSRDEYDDIRASVEAGSYEYNVEEENFDCAGYIAWLECLGEPAEKSDPDSSWSLA